MFFYLCFPLLHELLRRIPAERLRAWPLGAMGVVVAVPFAATLLPAEAKLPMGGLPETEAWLVSQFPPVRMLGFVPGFLVARLVVAGRRVPLTLPAASAPAVAAYVVAPNCPPSSRLRSPRRSRSAW